MRLAITLISLAFLSAGCTGSQFGGAVGKTGGGEKKPASGEGKKPAEEDLGNPEDDQETDQADDPVMVAGAFLTCVQDDALPQNDQTVTVGCVLKDKNQKKVSLDGAASKWTAIDMFNNDVGVPFATLPQEAPYHATTVLNRFGIELLRVRLVVAKNNNVREFLAPIQARGENGGSAQLPNMKEFGQQGDFQLGDDNFRDQGYCTEQLQRIDLSGSSLSFQITVKTKTRLAITMGHICGVSRWDNSVRVRDGSPTPVFDGTLARRGNDYAIPGMNLEPGAYTLEIYSPKWDGDPNEAVVGDRDDFVIGDFRFVFDGEVEVAEPLPSQIIEN